MRWPPVVEGETKRGTLSFFFPIPREFNEQNAMTQVREKIRNLETKRDTLLKLGIQLLDRCSYF